jgi:hypothetical protein
VRPVLSMHAGLREYPAHMEGFNTPMRHARSSLIAGMAALVLAACGGGGDSAQQPANVAPTARAEAIPSVSAGAAVTLKGTASSDSDGSIASYTWTQVSGMAVSLSNTTSAEPGFTAPAVSVVSTLTFSLVVADNRGAVSAASTVTITVMPVATNVSVTGMVRFARVSHSATFPNGLNYASPTMRPARGVIVRALDPGTQALLASTTTDASGNYSLTFASNINVILQVVAQMQRGSSQPLPRWDVRVQNGTAGNAPYTHTTASFNSSSGVQNIDIPIGINSAGAATDVRASGPFAILDTVYTAIQKVLTAAPTANFPELVIDWGVQAEGTHFTITNGVQNIALLSDLSEDTDEFDQHTVAHEFGHYIEHNFSRADSIGGRHALGEKLDMRVAFGEGFGYAFAAIVLDDPVVRDSFVNAGTQVSSTFNVETNPGASGCWCSESSVFSILWDLYDTVPDGSDSISVPFAAIWEVLIGPQRITPATTSIFSFVEALKASQPASAAAINMLVAAQNTNAVNINAFATNESFLPFPPPAMTLPLYPAITQGGGPVVVRSIDDGGHYNKAGNHGFLRFTPASSGPVTISLTTSNTATNRDPDFRVFNAGALVRSGTGDSAEYPETETFSVTGGQTYVIDAYDCANGCGGEEGTPGDYNLTVTIN